MRKLILLLGAVFVAGCSDVVAPDSTAHHWRTSEIQWKETAKPYHVKVVQDSAGVVRTLDVECRSGYSVATGKCLDGEE